MNRSASQSSDAPLARHIPHHSAPVGEWRITAAVPSAWFRFDLGVLKHGERTDEFHNLPPGPNNPVGILWVGLNRRTGNHGCIRLSNWDAATFFTLVGKRQRRHHPVNRQPPFLSRFTVR